MIYLLLAMLGLTACASAGAENDCAYYKEDGNIVTWSETPVKFYIHSSVPDSMHEGIRKAAQVWNNASKHDLIVVVGVDIGPLLPRKDGRNVVYYYPGKETKDKKTYLGVTTINYTGESIRDADISINSDEDFDNIFDISSVMVHEFGHSLGMIHRDDPKSVMFPTIYEYEVKTKLTNKDKANLWCGYL